MLSLFSFTWILIANSKFQLQILCSFGDITESVKLIGIPENNFLCIFIIASSPGVHTFFCLRRVNKKLPQGETSQNAFQKVNVNQLKMKNVHVRMGPGGVLSVKVCTGMCGPDRVLFRPLRFTNSPFFI